jgi:hypothetical protein
MRVKIVGTQKVAILTQKAFSSGGGGEILSL